MKTNILLADDHVLLVEALSLLINQQADMQVISKIFDAHALQQGDWQNVRVFVVDYQMPGNSLQIIESVKHKYPDALVIVLTGLNSKYLLSHMQNTKIDAVLTKNGDSNELVNCIRHLLSGKSIDATDPSDNWIALTKREHEVLHLLVEGLKNSQVALRLHLSTKTIDNHRQNIMRKLQVNNVAELVRTAIKLKLVDA